MRESRVREAMERSASDESFFGRRGQGGKTGNGSKPYREFQPIITLARCINCGMTAMHRSRFGVDCGEEACVEKVPAVVEKLQQDLQMAMHEHAKDTKYWDDKIGILEESLDFWRDLTKKRHESFRRLKIKLKRAKGVY